MKETTGELVAALAVMVAVGIFMAFFYYTLWPIVKENFDGRKQCSRAICEPCKINDKLSTKCETVTCHAKGSTEEFECVYRG